MHVDAKNVRHHCKSFKGCRPCRRPRNKQPRLADLLGVSHHFEWAIFRLSNNLTCLPSVISYLENCELCVPRVHRWAWWCPTVWMKLMQPRFNLKFYELFQHPAKKTMLRYAETLKLKPLSFSIAAALLLLLVSRLTSKSTCRQQNTMPLKDEQVPELHGKMPNVTSETVEKTIVFGGFTATAGCYCHLLLATFAPNAAADNRMPYLLLLLVDRTLLVC